MADVKQCDRCKKIYEKNEMFDKYGEMVIRERDYLTGDRFDLCDECIADLLNFLYRYPDYSLVPVEREGVYENQFTNTSDG